MAKIIADCTAVLLCGGKSSRMGFDKALLKIQGQYVILQTAEKLMELFEEVILVTNDSQKFSKAFRKCTIIQDMYLGKGPLGGIVTAMNYTQKAEVFVIACDIQTFSPKLVYQLASKRGQNQITIFDFKVVKNHYLAFIDVLVYQHFKNSLRKITIRFANNLSVYL